MEMTTEPAAVWADIHSIRPWENNPRKIPQAAVDTVADSIRRFGFAAPLIARAQDGRLIAGHARLKAALKLGLERVPVRFLDLDPADAHLLAIADNKTAELAEWDDEVLGAILADLAEQKLDLTAGTGFTEAEIERLIAGASEDNPVVEDDGGALEQAEELLAKWKVERGQLWVIPSAKSEGRAHRLLCGDSRERSDVLRLFSDERAVWMWTDPPYGVEYVGKTKDALRIQNDGSDGLAALLSQAFGAADAVLEDGAPIYVCHPAGVLSLTFGAEFVKTGWHLHETLVWVKDTMVLGHSDYHYQHEPILYGWKGKNRHWYGGRDQVTVLEVERPRVSATHPTEKPLKLIEAMLKNSSRPGDLGYEPFAGSGGTYAAAEQLGRVVVGLEIEPKYCAVILERLTTAGLEPRLVEGDA
jgi:DNA modification methylase